MDKIVDVLFSDVRYLFCSALILGSSIFPIRRESILKIQMSRRLLDRANKDGLIFIKMGRQLVHDGDRKFIFSRKYDIESDKTILSVKAYYIPKKYFY